MKRLLLSCIVLFSTQAYGSCQNQGYDPYMDPRVLDGLLYSGCISLDQYNKFQEARLKKEHDDAIARKRAAEQSIFGKIVLGVLIDVVQSSLSGSPYGSQAAFNATRKLRSTDEEEDEAQNAAQPNKQLPRASKAIVFPSAQQRSDNNKKVVIFPSRSRRPGSDVEQAKKEVAYHLAYQGRKR